MTSGIGGFVAPPREQVGFQILSDSESADPYYAGRIETYRNHSVFMSHEN